QESKRRQGFHVRSSCGAMRESGFIVGRKEQSGRPCGRPEDQTYFWVPSIPSVAWQPYPSPLGRLRAHSFASPPHDGFAFVEDSLKHCLRCESRGCPFASRSKLSSRFSPMQTTATDFLDFPGGRTQVFSFLVRRGFRAFVFLPGISFQDSGTSRRSTSSAKCHHSTLVSPACQEKNAGR